MSQHEIFTALTELLAYNLENEVRMAEVRKCPKCQSENVFRSRRRSLEYLLPFFRPYRCYTCERRFLMLSKGAPKAQRVRLEHRHASEKNLS